MVIGLTGGIGSGKSTVLNFFKELKIPVYEADVEAKKIMHNNTVVKNGVIQLFGIESYIDGCLNRTYIGGIVFKDKQKLAALNAIVHPAVHNHFQEFVFHHKNQKYIVYENAILFENGSDKLCDKIIVVAAPLETRIQRVLKRDNCTRDEVLNRINNQWDQDKKLELADYCIENIELSNLKNQVVDIHNKLMSL
ncbi:dephospho-CoA kinase [Flavobacteriaceae bacterium]|nr:dephospho-CoA kinase [Flavobacteriaceae bacterium]